LNEEGGEMSRKFPNFKPIVITFSIEEHKVCAEFRVVPPNDPPKYDEDWADDLDYPKVELLLRLPSGFLGYCPGILDKAKDFHIMNQQENHQVLAKRFSKPTLESSFNAAMASASGVVRDTIDYVASRALRMSRREHNIKCALESSPFELDEGSIH
jgi:hypothetical protein